MKASRNGIAATIDDVAGDRPHIDKAGLMIGNETGVLVEWRLPTVLAFAERETRCRRYMASQLKELHEFEEDMKEALGLASLYNTSLGHHRRHCIFTTGWRSGTTPSSRANLGKSASRPFLNLSARQSSDRS